MKTLSLTSKPARIATAVLLSSAMTAAFAGGTGEGGKAGRMTGGGSIICPAPVYRVTFGYELHCKTENGISRPNNLEVNFSSGEHFHLSSLDEATCSGPSATTPDAPFNTMTGEGSGTLNGRTAMISFELKDIAEPGRGYDTASFTITTTQGTALRCGPLVLEGGNNQAHPATGSKP